MKVTPKQQEMVMKALKAQLKKGGGVIEVFRQIRKEEEQCVFTDSHICIYFPKDFVEKHIAIDLRTKREIEKGVKEFEPEQSNYPRTSNLFLDLEKYNVHEYNVATLLKQLKELEKQPETKEKYGLIRLGKGAMEFSVHDSSQVEGNLLRVRNLLTILKVLKALGEKTITLYQNPNKPFDLIEFKAGDMKGLIAPNRY